MTILIRAGLMALAVVMTGCTTTGKFVVPPNTDLYLEGDRKVEVEADGTVTTRPFGFSGFGVPPSGGIAYRLEQNGRTVKTGNLRSKFRVVSLFWPPYAVFYWPAGLNPDITYDLVNDTQE